MATNADNVVVAITGAVYVAPTGTTPPTDSDTALDPAFVGVGYLSEDAVSETIAVDTNDIVAWQNSDTVRKVITSFGVEFTFTMIETNQASTGLYYGKAHTDGTSHGIGGTMTGRQAFVIDAIDTTGQSIRRYIPSGEVTERGEVDITGTDALGYEVTVAAYPSADLSGDTAKVYYGTALI